MSRPESSTDSNPPMPKIQIDHLDRVNFASAQNAVPVIRRLEIVNSTDTALADLTLTMTSQPVFLRDKVWLIDRVEAQDSVSLTDRDVMFDFQQLVGLNEAEHGQLYFRLNQSGTTLAKLDVGVELLARDEWGGVTDMAQILAAFIPPNDPVIAKLMKKASQVLELGGHESALEGYQSKDPKRTYMLAAAAWSAVSSLGLTYVEPPKSFEQSGQKIRDPERITEEGLATCLDTTLLMAGLLEAIGLNPSVIFVTGHAFAGVWLVEQTFPAVSVHDIIEVRKAISAKEFIAFETTMLTHRPSVRFDKACQETRRHFSEENEINFHSVIDVGRARAAGIRPLASHRAANPNLSPETTDVISAPLPPLPDFDLLPSGLVDENPTTPDGRIERWQRKLLDLSLRNRLLNFKNTKQMIPFQCSDVPNLEDRLANGEKMRVISLEDDDPVGVRDPAQYRRETGKDIHEEFIRAALDRGEVCVPQLSKQDMTARLTTLFRKAKSDMAEGGANTLFLAAGFLRWKRTPEDGRTYRAPLLLLPVELMRRSAQSDFQLRHHEDDVRINSTLLRFLEQDFNIRVPALQGELPTDESGFDLQRIFGTMRAEIRDVPGMEVTEELALATFSFAKYLMWKDLVDRTDSLRENRLVKHLIDAPDTPYADDHSRAMPKPAEIDQCFHPKDLVTPLPADSSQLAAVASAGDGHDMVIIGPPGTGKSQTIANMIAHCLAKGKSVLFVAEKSAALNVVYRRLKAHDLGNACLELHSNKADRRSVLSQLGIAWDRAATTDEQEWVDITHQLRGKRDELNAYVEALHTPGTHGFSVFDAVGIITNAQGTEKPPFSLAFAALDAHDEESFRHLLEVAEAVARVFDKIRSLDGLASISNSDWSHGWQQKLLTDAESLRKTAVELHDTANALAVSLTQSVPTQVSFEHLEALCRFAEATGRVSKDDYLLAMNENLGRLREGFENLETSIGEIRRAEDNLSAHYAHKTVLRIPISEMDRNWRESCAKFWPFSWLGQRRITKLLQSYAERGIADPDRDIEPLATIADHLKQIEGSDLRELSRFKGVGTNTTDLRVYLDNAWAFRNALADLKQMLDGSVDIVKRIEPLLAKGGDREDVAERAAGLLNSRTAYDAALAAYCGTAGNGPRSATLIELRDEMTNIARSAPQIRDWTKWVEVRTQAKAVELLPLIESLEQARLRPEHAVTAFRQAYFSWWLPLAIDSQSELRNFVSWEHMDRIKKFRELDAATQKLAPEQVRRTLTHDLPARDEVSRRSELGILRHQLNLQRPSKSIRNLISEIPETFTKLVPCVLMSPLSIAQYLPADQALFDLVIFDEASQINTWDAIGAIARGKQSVIVGDPKQLPPTNFFGRATSEEDEDLEEYEKDLPSILDEATTAGLPCTYLKWHYRSRDEALIAFSNHHYYNDRLVTFPSPLTDVDAVRFHKVNGVYGRGTNRTNVGEARAIVKLITERLKHALAAPENERETIGVVTFNVQQQELILDLLDIERRNNPVLEWFFDDNREEPLIVKNLENIQGDERDVMMFSITFGPDNAGKMSMSFGALNGDGGEKRLNVAVTRARSELHVFASITADIIDLARTEAVGVRHLKNFLDYAERGPDALPAMDEGSVGGADSPFETAVADALEAKGWEVRNQIGVSGFRIDLGVVHPDHAGAYLSGIECDGATYHGSATARDRDQIREGVLRNLGWEIVRIWSTDWFVSPGEACEQTHKELEAILATSRADEVGTNEPRSGRDANNPDTTNVALVLDDSLEGGSQGGRLFEQLPMSETIESINTKESNTNEPDPKRFFEATYTPVLESLIAEIVSNQGPMPDDLLARAIANEHGWQRVGRRIRDRVFACLGNVEVRNEGERRFLWRPGTFSERIPYCGHPDRAIRDISRSEIAGLINENPELMHAEDPEKELSSLLNVSRLTEDIRAYLRDCIIRSTGSEGVRC